MNNNTSIINSSPYLRTSRNFPEDDPRELSVEVNKTYVDIAAAVNQRTIGIFTTRKPTITGESFFITSSRQQTLRQLFTFTTTAAINHNITFSRISQFTRMYGQFTDGTNWYGLIAGSNVAIAGQISFYLTGTEITFLSGAGAPALTQGSIILEWLSDV